MPFCRRADGGKGGAIRKYEFVTHGEVQQSTIPRDGSWIKLG